MRFVLKSTALFLFALLLPFAITPAAATIRAPRLRLRVAGGWMARSMRPLLGLIVIATLAGCGGGEISQNTQTPARARQVQIRWLGGQSFLINSSLGTGIITNPSPSLPSGLRPDIVLITAENPDSNYVDAFDNTPTVFRGAVALGTHSATGIRFQGIPLSRDSGAPSTEKLYIAYMWTLDGIRFAYLGHLAGPLTPQQAAQIGSADVLFVPAGAAGISEAIARLHARVIIPMGPRAASWANAFPRVHRMTENSLRISREGLPPESTAVAFP